MPIVAGRGTPPPDVVARRHSYASAVWIDPTAAVWPLTDLQSGRWLTAGVAGLGSAKISMTTDKRSVGGESIRAQRYEPRILTLPLAVVGGSSEEFLDLYWAIEDAFSRTKEEGVGQFQITHPNGQVRAIDAVYSTGLDLDNSDGPWTWAVMPLQIYCPAGLWYDPVLVTDSRSHRSGGGSFYNRFPRVSSGRTLGETVMTNPGKVMAQPEWTLTGPFDSFTATNEDTGKTFEIVLDVLAGETVTIRTDPPEVIGPDGDSALAALTMPGSTFWGLPRGDSRVSFVATGSAAGTKIEWSFRKWYKTS